MRAIPNETKNRKELSLIKGILKKKKPIVNIALNSEY